MWLQTGHYPLKIALFKKLKCINVKSRIMETYFLLVTRPIVVAIPCIPRADTTQHGRHFLFLRPQGLIAAEFVDRGIGIYFIYYIPCVSLVTSCVTSLMPCLHETRLCTYQFVTSTSPPNWISGLNMRTFSLKETLTFWQNIICHFLVLAWISFGCFPSGLRLTRRPNTFIITNITWLFIYDRS